jgi:hypothetical protein
MAGFRDKVQLDPSEDAMEHSSSSIRIFMKPNQADTGRPRSPTPANTFHEKAILCRAA